MHVFIFLIESASEPPIRPTPISNTRFFTFHSPLYVKIALHAFDAH